MKNTLNTISLFTGAGGIDYGFEAAGFSTRVGIDIDPDSCETARRNGKWNVIEGDIQNISTPEILSTANLAPKEVDVLMGGPPCQPFSKSGYWVNGDTKRLQDPRAKTLTEYMRCVDEILPEVFLLENVHGIKYNGKEEGFQYIINLARQINRKRNTNYSLSWAVLNMAEYGIPQIRTRFFLVGHREGKKFIFPKKTHTNSNNSNIRPLSKSTLNESVTAWDALNGVKPAKDEDLRVKGYWADLLPSIPEGHNYLWHTEKGGGEAIFKWRSRYWSFLLKLAKNRPSWTIQAQPGPNIGPFHWENRLLSVKETAALMTFPEAVTVYGKRLSQQRQLGNAVPSLMAEIIAREIGMQYFNMSYDIEPKLKVKIDRPIPAPENILTVPDRYLHNSDQEPRENDNTKEKQALYQYIHG